MNARVWVNGEPSHCVDVSDRGFQYGDGVFSTVRVLDGTPLFLDRHLRRLDGDCRRLSIPFPGDPCLKRESHLLSADSAAGVLKIQITRGSGGRGYSPPQPAVPTRILSVHALPEYPPELQTEGVQVRICRMRLGINPRLAGVKHMNRLEQVLARQEWDEPEVREGLLLDAEGYVTEGTMSNLFLAKNGSVYTPKIDRCGVAGVMRGIVMETIAGAGAPVAEVRLRPEGIYEADELFLTNSVIGVWPIRRLADREFTVGPVTRMACRRFAELTAAERAATCTG